MRNDTKDILCDPELLRVRETHMERLDALFRGERLDRAFVLCGIGGPVDAQLKDSPEELVHASLDALAARAEAARDPHVFRPLCLEHWIYGVHFTDKMFGADVYEENGQWWSKPLPTPVGQLTTPDLEESQVWRFAQDLLREFLKTETTVPFVSPQVLGGPVNQTFNLYKENLLLAFSEAPEAARRDLTTVTQTLRAMHRWYRETAPPAQLQPILPSSRCQPRGHGQMCGCATHLVSGQLYRNFVADLDFADGVLADFPGGGMLHLCGQHVQHIPVWRETPQLRALQLNDRASEDLEAYFRGLREDQILYLIPTATMTVERAMEITGGHRLVLATNLEEPPRCRKRPQVRAESQPT